MRDATPARGEAASLLETVRCAYSQDWVALDSYELERRLAGTVAPDVILVPEPGNGDPAIGVGEVRRLFDTARDQWSSCRYLLEEVRPLGQAQVVVIGRLVATLRSSGSRASFPFVHAWHVEGTQVSRIEAFVDRAQASASLGRSL
jgi:hypothetical protein